MKTLILLILFVILLLVASFFGFTIITGEDPITAITGGTEQTDTEENEDGSGQAPAGGGDIGELVPQPVGDTSGSNGNSNSGTANDSTSPTQPSENNNNADPIINDINVGDSGDTIADGTTGKYSDTGDATTTASDQDLPETDLISDTADRILLGIAVIVFAFTVVKYNLVANLFMPAAKYPRIDTYNIDPKAQKDKKKLVDTLDYVSEATQSKQ